MYFNFDLNLRGLIPLLLIMATLSVLGIYKLVEIIIWLFNHVRIV